MNRYYPPSIEEAWESYEWLLKRKLEEIDHMAREIYKDMAMLRVANKEMMRAFMQERFAELWNQVAAEQEGKSKYRRASE